MSEPTSPTESALVVQVPAAEPAVANLRELYDPAARWGVPAHVTILYPFVPPVDLDDAVMVAVADLVAGFEAFDFSLDKVDQFGTEVLFIRPNPADRFRALTDAVADKWPQHPPYEGVYEDVIPHLTVAHTGKGASFDAIRARVSSELPIQTRTATVDLMIGSFEPASWQTIEVFHLNQPAPPATPD